MKKTILFLAMFISIIILSSCSYINFNKTTNVNDNGNSNYQNDIFSSDINEREERISFIKSNLSQEQLFYISLIDDFPLSYEYLEFKGNDITFTKNFSINPNRNFRTDFTKYEDEDNENWYEEYFEEHALNLTDETEKKSSNFLVTDKYNNAYINDYTHLSDYNEYIKTLNNNDANKKVFDKVKYNNLSVYLPKAFTDENVCMTLVKYEIVTNLTNFELSYDEKYIITGFENITFEQLKEKAFSFVKETLEPFTPDGETPEESNRFYKAFLKGMKKYFNYEEA